MPVDKFGKFFFFRAYSLKFDALSLSTTQLKKQHSKYCIKIINTETKADPYILWKTSFKGQRVSLHLRNWSFLSNNNTYFSETLAMSCKLMQIRFNKKIYPQWLSSVRSFKKVCQKLNS